MSDKKITIPDEPLHLTKVKIIETRGESSMVEWTTNGHPERGYVPNEAIEDGKAPAGVLALAMPVGPDILNMDMRRFNEQVRLHGLWTKADFMKNARLLVRCLFIATGVN